LCCLFSFTTNGKTRELESRGQNCHRSIDNGRGSKTRKKTDPIKKREQKQKTAATKQWHDCSVGSRTSSGNEQRMEYNENTAQKGDSDKCDNANGSHRNECKQQIAAPTDHSMHLFGQKTRDWIKPSTTKSEWKQLPMEKIAIGKLAARKPNKQNKQTERRVEFTATHSTILRGRAEPIYRSSL